MRAPGSAAPPGPAPDAGRRVVEERVHRVWRRLVGVQLLAAALVVAAVVAIWLVGLFGDLYGAR
ncbi:MAG TPA: hypothetical protein VFO60_01690 [Candidatus Dormibacteraeota bacterium]|nr:hypothetical protein [Candidatus Dormibacteraeota bacterium]